MGREEDPSRVHERAGSRDREGVAVGLIYVLKKLKGSGIKEGVAMPVCYTLPKDLIGERCAPQNGAPLHLKEWLLEGVLGAEVGRRQTDK